MAGFDYTSRIVSKIHLTYNVVRLRFERPEGFGFSPGQAIYLNLEGFQKKLNTRPFSFTGLNSSPFLEIIFKIYPSHCGTTLALSKAKIGDSLSISRPFTTFTFTEPGTFIAGGTGITPFLSILRQLEYDDTIEGNQLIFANKTCRDIFLEAELAEYLGAELIEILSHERCPGYFYGRIDADFLEAHSEIHNRQFYLCGPEGFSLSIRQTLANLGANLEMISIDNPYNSY